MTEREIMQRAKQYIDAMANGFDPLTGKPVPESDTINQMRISRCLFYVSGVLQKVIENGGEVKKSRIPRSKKAPFSLTSDQISKLRPYTSSVSVSKIVSAINELIDSETMKKLKSTTVTNWLVSVGLLTEIAIPPDHKRRSPTPDGEQLGMKETSFTDENGTSHNYTVYNMNAQQFILDHLEYIIVYAQETE